MSTNVQFNLKDAFDKVTIKAELGLDGWEGVIREFVEELDPWLSHDYVELCLTPRLICHFPEGYSRECDVFRHEGKFLVSFSVGSSGLRQLLDTLVYHGIPFEHF